MPSGKLAKWQLLLCEFNIIYGQKMFKLQDLVDHNVENPVDEDYRPFQTYFPDEEVLLIGEDIYESYLG